jgi:hypothetical protein
LENIILTSGLSIIGIHKTLAELDEEYPELKMNAHIERREYLQIMSQEYKKYH